MKIKDQKDLDLPGFSCHNVLLTKMIQTDSVRVFLSRATRERL